MVISLDMRTAKLGGEAHKRKKFLSNTNEVRLSCPWPVYQRDGQWYVLSAGFPEDSKIREDD